MSRRVRGFSLIELITVITIVAIVAAIIFPVFARSQESARKASSLSQIRQIADAQLLYEADNSGGYALERGLHSSWQDQVVQYLPGVSSFHPPLFAFPARQRGSNGYVVNFCLTEYSPGMSFDASGTVMISEYAVLSLTTDNAHGEVGAFVFQFPDVVVAKFLSERENELISPLGAPGATKYAGRGVYAFMDTHAAVIGVNEFFYKNAKDWCEAPAQPHPGTGNRAHYALY